jgi:hypothetical protein
MKKLSKLKATPTADHEAQRLLRWLHEWELMQASSRGEGERQNDQPSSGAVPEACIASVDADVETGQIRLLTPQGDAPPLFIAIADMAADANITCVPFGLLSEPATPDELLSGRDTPAIRVLCLWNARKGTREGFRDSWIVDTLTNDELKRLKRALHACEQTGHVPDDLRREAGPPLVHPEDPRRVYRHMERERLNALLVRERPRQMPDNVILYEIESDRRELPKAAEDHDTYEV